METIHYTEEKMERVKEQVQRMIQIVKELEADFPGRHFTLDGHLVGSIGEVMAAYYYGIELYAASAEIHDGEVDEKRIQVKITQQEKVMISHEPDYLIVLYLQKTGNIYEVYNGPGRAPWENSGKADSHNNHHMRINKLMELDALVNEDERIVQINPIEKMRQEYKNKK